MNDMLPGFEDLPVAVVAALKEDIPEAEFLRQAIEEELKTPPELDPRLLYYLETQPATELKRLARRLCGTQVGQPPMAQAKEHIRGFWRSWERIMARARSASKEEQSLLGLLNRFEQDVPAAELMAYFWMSGIDSPHDDNSDPSRFSYISFAPLNRLMEAGLAYRTEAYSRYYDGYSSYYYSVPKGIDGVSHLDGKIFTPEPLCQWFPHTEPEPLSITPVEFHGSGTMRRPVEASMRFATLIEELRKMRKISVRQDGQLSQTVFNTLEKKVSWLTSLSEDPTFPLPNATEFYLGILLRAGVLGGAYPQAAIAEDVDQLLDLPYVEQTRVWMTAYQSHTGWAELRDGRTNYEIGGLDWRMLSAMRQLLFLSLRLLPHADAWYRVSDYQEALFQRLGGRFSLWPCKTDYESGYSRRQLTDSQRAAIREERTRRRWVAMEFNWIRNALFGPLFQFGLVEFRRESEDAPNDEWLFRPTPLCRQVMLIEPSDEDETAPPVAAQCWLVQPNFDVIAYADRATARQIAFINRIAERASSEGPVLTFRLTRASIYAALESGLGADALFLELQAGAERTIPDTVLRTLRDWASRRDQLQVIPAGALLEYPSEQERDAALKAGGISGVAFGERMILVDEAGITQAKKAAACVIDYSLEPVKCLTVKEPADLKVDLSRADLYLRQALPRFADALEDGSWRISPNTFKRASKAGMTSASILTVLQRYASRALPALVPHTLRAWESTHMSKNQVGLGNAIILTVANKTLADAMAASSLLRPVLGARLGENAFAVEESKLEQVESLLRSLGFVPGSAGKR